MDSGATDHITGELNKMTIRDKYHGGEQVHAANGSGMEISHVGHSTLQSPSHKIHLRNILHVPSANKSLVSINRLTRDNNVFVEFHPKHFLIKEQGTKQTLHRGKCEAGLYPIKLSSSESSLNKQALGVAKVSSALWHHRLGHPSTPVVQHILSHHSLPASRDKNNNHVCDSCQQGKMHQLPYPNQLVCHLVLWSLCFQMFGDLPQHQSVVFSTMLVSSMIILNLLGFICFDINQMCFNVSVSFKI
jgi:hypothetical protein